MPLIVALILFAILGYPVYWQHAAVPGGLFGVILACAVVLLLLPYTLVYELVLRGARDTLATQARRGPRRPLAVGMVGGFRADPGDR